MVCRLLGIVLLHCKCIAARICNTDKKQKAEIKRLEYLVEVAGSEVPERYKDLTSRESTVGPEETLLGFQVLRKLSIEAPQRIVIREEFNDRHTERKKWEKMMYETKPREGLTPREMTEFIWAREMFCLWS